MAGAVIILSDCLGFFFSKNKWFTYGRLISVEEVRNYLSHIIYILIFDFFLNFPIICQTPDFNIQDVGRRYNSIREASEI